MPMMTSKLPSSTGISLQALSNLHYLVSGFMDISGLCPQHGVAFVIAWYTLLYENSTNDLDGMLHSKTTKSLFPSGNAKIGGASQALF
ncbi:hypothetical protein Tco_1394161 [Tanacetum coccineum]